MGTGIAKQKMEDVRKLFKGAFYDRSVISQPVWEIWRSVIKQYHLSIPSL